MRQRDYSLSEGEGRGEGGNKGEGDMEIPPHPATARLASRVKPAGAAYSAAARWISRPVGLTEAAIRSS